jgi:hypothetical protein
MKKLNIIIFFLGLLIYVNNMNAEDSKDAEPLNYKKTDNNLNIFGTVYIYNGWQPNLRLITPKNEVIGIGIDESVSIPNEINKFLPFGYEITGTFELKFINYVSIPYYNKPLPCFDIIKILKMEVKSTSTSKIVYTY